MSKLDDLLYKLCPNGVEFKTLDECCYLEKGKTPIQKAVPGQYPLVVTTAERKTSSSFQFERPTVCIPLVSSRGHGVACLNQLFYQEGQFALGNILCGVTPKNEAELSAKFLHYYLNHKKDVLIVPLMKGGANVSLTVDSLRRVKVPVPPMEVQQEIMRLLTDFSDLIDGLSEELSARKLQYGYYRTKLLSQDKYKPYMVPLSALGKWTGGKTPSMAISEYWDNGTIPWISSKDMKEPILTDTQDHITEVALTDASMTLYPEGCVAIVTRSGILKHTFPVAYVPFKTTVNQDIKILVANEDVCPKYVAQALRAFEKDILFTAKKQGGTVDSLDFDKLMDYRISFLRLQFRNVWLMS